MTTTDTIPENVNGSAAAIPTDRRQLLRSIRESAKLLDRAQVRYLVDLYYQVQDFRIAAAAQVREMIEADEPNYLMSWQYVRFEEMEGDIVKALDSWTDTVTPGRWAKTIKGIGPVIAAGLIAQIPIENSRYAGQLWSFAGIGGDSEWKKGQKRPWNARLKTLCWKAGESFVKQSNRDGDIYGHLYAERKALETSRNEAGKFAGQAAAALKAKSYGKETEARKWYEQGKLPPAHIHARARRFAVKLFLAHLHHVMWEDRFGEPPERPYILNLPEHTHYFAPPNWPMEQPQSV